MRIVSPDWKWAGTLTPAGETEYIVLHHAAAEGSAEAVHGAHLARGWSGIGYHFYVRLDGTVYSGRPLGTIGAHTAGYNSRSVGVCFEGNFEVRTMPTEQLAAGRELISYLRGLYPKAKIVRHKDLDATACPGKNFPFEAMTGGALFRVQAGAFTDRQRAERYAERLRNAGFPDAYVVG